MQHMDSQKYFRILEQQVAPGTVSEAQIIAGLTDSHLDTKLIDTTDANAQAALNRLVQRAQEFGLSDVEFKEALADITEQLTIESSAVARHAHEQDKKSTSFYQVQRIVSQRWNTTLETFGRGKIVEHAKQHRAAQLQDVDYMEQLVSAAVERRSFRKRYQEYRTLGGDEFQAKLDQFASGAFAAEDLQQSGEFWDGISNIMNGMDLPDPMVIGKDSAGLPIEVPLTPDNEASIRRHLRFVLADEVTQMAQMNRMKVMETKGYEITDKTRPGLVASKLLGSGTAWGVSIRGARYLVGGSIAAATIGTGGLGLGLLAGTAGWGALMGYGSQVVQYRWGRRIERKMDLALQGSNQEIEVNNKRVALEQDASGNYVSAVEERETKIEAVKRADDLNVEMAAASVELNTLVERISSTMLTPDQKRKLGQELTVAIDKAYRVVVDVETRLLMSRLNNDTQDYIAFGIKNRVGAQTELLKNARALNLLMHEGMSKIDRSTTAVVEEHLFKLANESRRDLMHIRKNLESSILMQGEGMRRIFGAVLGGTFATLSSYAMESLHGWLQDRGILPDTDPTFPGNESKTISYGGQELKITPNAEGDLLVTNPEGVTTTIDIPETIDVHKVVLGEDLQLFDATTGQPVAHMDIEFTPAGVSETLKTPTLEPNLAPNNNELFSVGSKQFGMAVDKDGNLLLAKLVDGKLDVDHPLVSPIATISEALRQHFNAEYPAPDAAKLIEQAAQFRMEHGSDGTVVVKSIFGGAEVAKFHINPDGTATAVAAAVPEPAAPTPGAAAGDAGKAWVDKLFADPHSPIATLLKKMGVDPGEINLKPDGTFEITDEAVKGEYLGATESWRQTRLELLLEALKDGKIPKDEPAEMIVARLERATNHLILAHDKYPNTDAAIDEAFGKSDAFIKEQVLPWVRGPKSHISVRWEKLVDALRNSSDPAASSTPTAAGAGSGAAEAAPSAPGAVVPPVEAAPGSKAVADVVHELTRDMIFNNPAQAKLEAEISSAVSSWLLDGATAALETTLALAGIAGGEITEDVVRPSHLVGPNESKPAVDAAQSRTVQKREMGVLDTKVPDPEAAKIADIEARLSEVNADLIGIQFKVSEIVIAITDRNEVNNTKEARTLEKIDSVDKRLALLITAVPDGHPKTAELKKSIADSITQANEQRVKLEEVLLSRNSSITEKMEDAILGFIEEVKKPENSREYAVGLLGRVDKIEDNTDLLDNNYAAILEHITSISPEDKKFLLGRVARLHDSIIELSRAISERLNATVAAPAEPDDDVLSPDEHIEGDVDDETEVVPIVTPPDPEAARKRLEASQKTAEQQRAVDAWKAKMDKANALLSTRLLAEYGTKNLPALEAITNAFEQEGILDATHTAAWYREMNKLVGNGQARLEQAGILNVDGSVDNDGVLKIVQNLKADPQKTPF